MTLIGNAIIQNGQPTDDCLHKPGFDVNPEMFRKNDKFRKTILGIVDYMITILQTDFDDYSKLKGISGANVGIPLNIVIVSDNDLIRVFINPKIMKTSRSKISVLSNCGSVNLPKSIKIERYSWIQIEWININGKRQEKKFVVGKYENNKRSNISLTLQHEIEHNKGILIIDKKNFNTN